MIHIDVKKKLHSAQGWTDLHIKTEIPIGSFLAVSGDSGAGKTTLLRMIAGLTAPDEGTIRVKDKTWFDSARKINLQPQSRKIGFVFQDYGLFPHLNVEQHLSFVSDDPSHNRTLLDVMGLLELRTRFPRTLSGGQKQRLALARAIAAKPDILLMDEPLSALDETIRQKLQDSIIEAHRLFGLTSVIISHDIPEIFRLTDRVIILDNGRVERSGTPSEVFLSKKISTKFSFSGKVLQIKQADIIHLALIVVNNQLCEVVISASDAQTLKPGDRVFVGVKAFNPIIKKIED